MVRYALVRRLTATLVAVSLAVSLVGCDQGTPSDPSATLAVSVAALSEDIEVDLPEGTYEVSATGSVTDGIALVNLTIFDVDNDELVSTFNLDYVADEVGGAEGATGSAPPTLVVLVAGETGSAALDFTWDGAVGRTVEGGIDFAVNFDNEEDAPTVTAMVATNIGETTTDDVITVYVSTETETTTPLIGVVQILDNIGTVVREAALVAIPDTFQYTAVIDAPPVGGEYTLRSVVTDENGNSTEAVKSFSVDLGSFKTFEAFSNVPGTTFEGADTVETTILAGSTLETVDGSFVGKGFVGLVSPDTSASVLFEVGPNNLLLEVGPFIFAMTASAPDVVQTDFGTIPFETFIGNGVEEMNSLPFIEWQTATVAFAALAAVGLTDVSLTNIAIAQIFGFLGLSWCELGVITAAAVVGAIVGAAAGAACTSICAVGTTVTVGALAIPCVAIIAFCTGGAGALAYGVLHEVLRSNWNP